MPPAAPAVFLDRDNTLIVNDGDLGDPDAVVLMQGVAMAVASICGLGFRTVVVTNQGGVARGKYDESDVHAVHERLAGLVGDAANGARLDAFYYCPFHPEGRVHRYSREHPDRKPAPGMLLRAAADLKLDLRSSWMVGDAMRDVAAGQAAGCRTVLLRRDAAQQTPARVAAAEPLEVDGAPVVPDYLAASLVEAVRIIASQRHARAEAPRRAPPAAPGAGDAASASKGAGVPPIPSLSAGAARPPAVKAEPEEGKREREPLKGDVPAVTDAGAEAKPFRPMMLAPVALPESGPEQADAAAPPSNGFDVEPSGEGITELGHAAPAAAAPETGASDVQAEGADGAGAQRVLRQILQELRGQRGQGGRGGGALIAAAVLQVIALVCLLGGLWMSAGAVPPTDSTELLLRWMFAGLIAQGAAVCVLLAGR